MGRHVESSLVPHGRTHRLSVVVARMLHSAYDIAQKKKTCSSCRELIDLYDRVLDDPEEGMDEVIKLAESLFRDAGVRYKRVNSRGTGYSIADRVAYEFVNWESIPWEA